MQMIGGGMADSIVIDILKGDYFMVRDKPTWDDGDREELLKSIQQVLRFHMTDEEWKEWERQLH